MGWQLAILGFVSTVVAAASLGIADAPDPKNLAVMWRDGDGPPPVTRCEDLPPIPRGEDVGPGWGADESGVTMDLLWTDGSGANEEWFNYVVRVDDPTCKERPEIWKYVDIDETPPRFENARIYLRPGQDRAYVGYTLIDNVGELFVSLHHDGVTATRADGLSIKWKHQTSTGGPSEIGAHGTSVVEPADDVGPYRDVGDADYFDATDLKIGETITVTFRFVHIQDTIVETRKPPKPRAVVKVPFRVVAAS